MSVKTLNLNTIQLNQSITGGLWCFLNDPHAAHLTELTFSQSINQKINK